MDAERTPGTLPSALQVLRVRLCRVQCAIPLDYIERVLPLATLQQIPGAPHHLVGIMNYRGLSLPVVDLGGWIGVEGKEAYHIDTPILLCGHRQTRIGFVVSEVMQIETVEASMLQLQGALSSGGCTPFAASLNTAAGLALLLDMEQIMAVNFADAGISCGVDAHLLSTLQTL
jgi:purine-binding chemotaxis protein CheW